MRWLLLIIILGVTAILRFTTMNLVFVAGADLMISLGFIILFSFLIGKMVVPLGLPMITGYLIAGILAGPQLSSLLSSSVTHKLHLIDQIALGIIALTAGGELRIPVIKQQLKSITYIVIFQLVLVYLGVGIGLYLLGNLLGIEAETSLEFFIIVLFLTTTAVANSPATAIAVITETRAAGAVTQRVIGITVAKDVIVLILITATIAVSEMLLSPGKSGAVSQISHLFLNLTSSFLVGGIVGLIIIGFLKYVHQDTTIFILGVVFAVSALAELLHLELIMVCVTAGFIVQNYSSYGKDLIASIEESSLPVYVIFFSIAGASLNMNILMQYWNLALVLVLLRLVTTILGSYWGSKLANDEPPVQKYVWTGFVGQAGITLGMAIIIGNIFADSFGPFLRTVILSAIVINQIIGPVIFRVGLQKVDEIAKKPVRRMIENETA